MTHHKNLLQRAHWFGGTIVTTIAVFIEAFSLTPADPQSFETILNNQY